MGELCALGLGKTIRNGAQERVVWSGSSLHRSLRILRASGYRDWLRTDFIEWGSKVTKYNQREATRT